MIIDNECARLLLKELSVLKLNEYMILNDFLMKYPSFSEETISKVAYYLSRYDYISINGSRYYEDNLEIDKYSKVKFSVRYRDAISYSLFDDELWKQLKEKIDIQKYTFQVLVDLLIKMEVLELNKVFGIPNDLVVKIS